MVTALIGEPGSLGDEIGQGPLRRHDVGVDASADGAVSGASAQHAESQRGAEEASRGDARENG